MISITGGTHITQGAAKMNDTYFDSPAAGVFPRIMPVPRGG